MRARAGVYHFSPPCNYASGFLDGSLRTGRASQKGEIQTRRSNFRRISGRNRLVGRVMDIKIDGFVAQVTVSIGEQCITSIITADAIREMQLKPGQTVTALIKSTEVMMMLR
jgi:molybdopterin-binding protein